jgi:hypothetical protein
VRDLYPLLVPLDRLIAEYSQEINDFIFGCFITLERQYTFYPEINFITSLFFKAPTYINSRIFISSLEDIFPRFDTPLHFFFSLAFHVSMVRLVSKSLSDDSDSEREFLTRCS